MLSAAGPPPGAGSLADTALRALRPAAGACLAAVALVVLPAAALVAGAPLLPATARLPVRVGLPALAALLAVAAGIRTIADAGVGSPPSALSVLRVTARRLPALVTVTAVGTVEVAAGLLLLVLPGLARLSSLQVALPVLLLEEAGPRQALRRTRVLMRSTERVALRAQAVLTLVAIAAAALPVALLLLALPRPAGGSDAVAEVRLVLAGAIIAAAVLPCWAAGQFAVFLSRRERLEALDLQLELQRLCATPLPLAVAA